MTRAENFERIRRVQLGSGRAARRLPRLIASAAFLIVIAGAEFASAQIAQPPNLLLVTLDTFRWDATGLSGNEANHTPNLDALGAAGTVFENAYSAISTTLPSHATMLTGLYPRSHGVRWNGDTLDEKWQTLTEILHAAGYRTGAFVSFKTMIYGGGLGQGFEIRSPNKRKSNGKGERPLPIRSSKETNEMAMAWLTKQKSAPFFLWVHYYDAHIPYVPTPYSKAKLADYGGPLKNGVDLLEMKYVRGRHATSQDLAALHTLYLGGVRATDQRLGDLLAFLDRSGLRSNTIIVVVADHGEMLGEHGEFSHGTKLWEEALRVPFVITDPRDPIARRVAQRVGLVDLTPTVLDLLGMHIPSRLQGRSITAALRGKRLTPALYYAESLSETKFDRKKVSAEKKAKTKRVCVYRGRYKLTLRAEAGADLFDLVNDPKENHPLNPETSPGLELEYDQLIHLARQHQALRKGMRSKSVEDLAPETLEELRSLGYVP